MMFSVWDSIDIETSGMVRCPTHEEFSRPEILRANLAGRVIEPWVCYLREGEKLLPPLLLGVTNFGKRTGYERMSTTLILSRHLCDDPARKRSVALRFDLYPIRRQSGYDFCFELSLTNIPVGIEVFGSLDQLSPHAPVVRKLIEDALRDPDPVDMTPIIGTTFAGQGGFPK